MPAGPLAPQCVGTGRTSTASGLFSMGEEEEDDRILEERERGGELPSGRWEEANTRTKHR